jgi:hypothetical protein
MTRFALLIAIAAAIAVPHRAQAADCSTLPNAVYLQVGDTQQNLMIRLGRALRDNKLPNGDPNPITLVYITSGSCSNIAAIYPPTVPIKVTTTMKYIQSKAELGDDVWTPATPTLTCTLDVARVPDIANSALFNSACVDGAPPATVHLTQGPTQAYVMAVPRTISTQTAITFEEAYFVFGFGTAGMIMPWIDESQMYIRTVTKSTLLAWAANIGVPGPRWKGQKFDGSPMVVGALEASTSPGAIGILGAEVYDGDRTKLKALAFRAKGQYAAYYPDSSESARDKKNVRDGHYTVWSPTIWMDTVDAGGVPVNPTARYVIDLIAGKTVTPAQSFPMIDIVAAVGLVPICAMRVNRTIEGGELTPFSPPESCTCKYESLVDTSSCAKCDATSCATGVCRNGLCEDH